MSTSSISFQDHVGSSFGTINNAAEGLLDLFGKARKVTVIRPCDQCQSKGGFNTLKAEKQGWKTTALKIAAWVGSGFLLPLLALAWKAAVRLNNSSLLKQLKPLKPEQKPAGVPTPIVDHNPIKPVSETQIKDTPTTEASEVIKFINIKPKSIKDHIPNFEVAVTFLIANKEHVTHLDLSVYYKSDAKDEQIRYLLENLPNLEYLNLSTLSHISDETLNVIGSKTKIKTLHLGHLELTAAEDLEFVKDLVELRELNLTYCKTLDGDALKYLKGLKKLETLDLYLCDKIKEHHLDHLKGLDQLQIKNFHKINPTVQKVNEGTPYGTGGYVYSKDNEGKLKFYKKYKDDVTYLDLNSFSPKLTEDELCELLGEMKALKFIGLKFYKMTPKIAEALKKHAPSLEKIDLQYTTGLTDEHLECLSGTTQLQEVNFATCEDITVKGLSHLIGNQGLKIINFYGCDGISTEDYASFLQDLKDQHPDTEIQLQAKNLSDINPKVESLNAGKTTLDKAILGLKVFSDAHAFLEKHKESITNLDLSFFIMKSSGYGSYHLYSSTTTDVKLKDEDMVFIGENLTNLDFLNLALYSFDHSITADGLSEISKLTKLKELRLPVVDGLKVEDFSFLKHLPALEFLDLSNYEELNPEVLNYITGEPVTVKLNQKLKAQFESVEFPDNVFIE